MNIFLQTRFSNVFFVNESVWISIKFSLKFVPKGPYSSIGSDDGLVLVRRQAIIWTNDGYFTDAYFTDVSLGLNELRTYPGHGPGDRVAPGHPKSPCLIWALTMRIDSVIMSADALVVDLSWGSFW